MPTYQYYCTDNHQTVDVLHGMSRRVETWGEVCELADRDLGATPADAPVEKLLGTGMVLTNSRADLSTCSGPTPAGGCCGGMCGGG